MTATKALRGIEQASPVSPAAPPDDTLHHVLVVDADPVARLRVCAILRENGIPALTAESSDEIIARAGEAMTVLLSLVAADEERITLIRRLRDLGPHRPAILLMTDRGQALLSRALESGADDYMVIPPGPVELLARLKLVADRRRLEAEQVMLRRIAVNVATGHENARLFSLVAHEVALLLGADGGRVVRYLAAGEAELLGSWRRSDLEQIPAGELLTLAPSWAIAQVQRSERPARSEPTEADAQKARAPMRASLAAPVRVEGRLWGAVAVTYAALEGARQETLVQLERVAELISLAVSNADAREHLGRLARTDPLTGLLNHGAFHDRLGEEVQRAARHGRSLSIALLDIDHFKKVNDQHGHPAGDSTLKIIAGLIRSHARATDVLGRVGGEELAWLMPECALAGAAKAAGRLCSSIEATPMEHGAPVTASLGVSELEIAGSAADFFGSADRALYRAKDAGRNCVRIWERAIS